MRIPSIQTREHVLLSCWSPNFFWLGLRLKFFCEPYLCKNSVHLLTEKAAFYFSSHFIHSYSGGSTLFKRRPRKQLFYHVQPPTRVVNMDYSDSAYVVCLMADMASGLAFLHKNGSLQVDETQWSRGPSTAREMQVYLNVYILIYPASSTSCHFRCIKQRHDVKLKIISLDFNLQLCEKR